MYVLKLALLAAFCAGVQSGGGPGLACSLKMDLAFLVDSSSSVKEGNFELIRQFVINVVQQLDIGPDATQVSLARFNNWVDSRFHFSTLKTKAEVINAIRETPYYGRGTKTANGLSVIENQHIREYNGWRKNEVPTVVVVLTDGKAQDAELIPMVARKLRSKVTKVIAVGVGKADQAELELIATRPFDENVIYIGEFSSLTTLVIRLARQACAVRDDVNECRQNNGGCETFCINTADAFYCECNEGFQVGVDGLTCDDIDECLADPGCESTCENTPGSYICSCPIGEIVVDDGRSCVADSCFANNECDQECTNIMGGDFVCSCLPGYVLNEDGRTCSDINECDIAKGGCEFECNNTAGSYECVCDEGFALRADGHTCGIQCYVCDRATSNEDCDQIEVCPPNALSCQTHVRYEQGVSYISKMCKQTEACVNNYIQNPRTAWSPTQCNDEGLSTSVCRCCCHRSLCNSLADCDKEKEIDIVCPDPDTFEIPDGLQVECEGNKLGHRCQLICPSGFAPDTGSTELVCTHRPRTTEGYWLGEIGPCVDIDECAVNNGGCSHFCTNTEGSYSCSCYNPFECAAAAVDVLFILDSSSSVKNPNFELMKTFVARIVNPLNIGQDDVRVALMRYNRFQIKEFDFNEVANNTDLAAKIAAVPYDGRGTRTAAAIEYAISSMIQDPDSGRRPSFPLITIIITDGRSWDGKQLENAASRLHQVSDAVFAIGISNRVNERELLIIANNRTQNYRLIESFADLDEDLVSLVSDQLCTETEGVHLLMVDGMNCDINECAIDNGGCSHSCNNTIGSFFCSCPAGQALIEDGATCVLNDCLIDNGGCEFECVQFSSGRRCMCPNSKQFEEEGCVNYNECDDANGGCSDICEDLDDGYRCACPDGYTLTGDGQNCEIDSCANQEWPFVCAQICENVPGGSYQCKCDEGYLMEDDGHNCTEIDECKFGNGGCEHTCVNTDGSYRCECPADQDLRADGKTCGIQCFQCVNVLDPDLECEAVVCDPSADACFTTHRTRDNVTMTTKGCKQTMACINNMIQNPASAGEGPSQCNLNLQNSKCECCCMTSLCNEGDCPYDNFTLPSCPSFQKAFTVFTGLQADGSVLAGGMARVDCGEGYVLAETEGSLLQIQCAYNFINGTAEWDNDYRDLDTCVDIDECDTENNGGCQAPAFCVNLPGSFECRCPEEPGDYVLVERFVCERNECADEDQGGCSDNCTNTIGSYFCSCPPGMSIVDDGLICDPDECMDANGGCHQLCVNVIGGHRCECHSDGYTIGDDGQTCVDVDECLVDNGQCSDICVNLEPGFECQCPEGYVLQADGFQCLPDPCFTNNGGCSQICTAVGEAVSCSCRQGFELLDDGTCVDIDECEDGIANCQYNCTNTDGGYNCECPAGEALRPDGRTCGRACYACNGAATNEECNVNIEVCPMDADACENEVRVHGGRKSIFKRCKQAHACNNNQIQNPRLAWMPSQCNGEVTNDVCRCCCSGHLCNFNERPCAAKAEDCALRQADIIVILDSSSSVKYDDFQLMKNFAKEIFSSYNIGETAVRAALVRYNRQVDVQFSLNDHTDLEGVLDAVDATPHRGSGTRTGQALQHVLDVELTEGKGARPGVPKIVITVTDGKSQDDVAGPSSELRRQGVKTIGVGIGSRIDREEIAVIGGSEASTIVSESFQDIFNQLEIIKLETCRDTDECENNNGGCSDGCQNTPGSFYCTCPEGLFLQEDLVTCGTAVANQSSLIFNECAQDNGGCQQDCTDLRDGFACSCKTGYGLRDDERTCAEINECDSEDTNPCSHSCVNTDGGFFCECPEDHEMTEDLVTCVPRPGPADCPSGFQAIAGSCVQLLSDSMTNAAAESACAAVGGRLATIRNKGVYDLYRRVFGSLIQQDVYIGLDNKDGDDTWTNSDGTDFSLGQYWGPDQPGSGLCGVIIPGSFLFGSRPCTYQGPAICQIPRETGFVVFGRTWPNGAQGKIYFPYGADQVRVEFPRNLKSLNVWFGTPTKVSGRVYTVSQNDIEIQSGMGEAQFVCDMGTTRFPDYNVEVTVEP